MWGGTFRSTLGVLWFAKKIIWVILASIADSKSSGWFPLYLIILPCSLSVNNAFPGGKSSTIKDKTSSNKEHLRFDVSNECNVIRMHFWQFPPSIICIECFMYYLITLDSYFVLCVIPMSALHSYILHFTLNYYFYFKVGLSLSSSMVECSQLSVVALWLSRTVALCCYVIACQAWWTAAVTGCGVKSQGIG